MNLRDFAAALEAQSERDNARRRWEHSLGRPRGYPIPEQLIEKWGNVVAEIRDQYRYVEHPDKTIQMAKKEPKRMKKGGLIKKTDTYMLHKGEVVVPANRVKSVDTALKKDKKKPLKK